tara:strand:+ start:1482 stop:2216 length:735 start_codon:yes stop_codon:yes gene_type:complete
VKPSFDYGVYQNLPFDKYKQLPGLNQSTLKLLISKDREKRNNFINNYALQFGSAGHCLLLEPEKFEDLYICAPKNLSQRKKKGKEQWQEFCNLNIGKIVLRYNDWSRLKNIQKSFLLHPKIKKIFSNGNSEVSLFWRDSEYDLDCKSRLDWFDEEHKKIIDLKFTQNISKTKINNHINNNFSIQANWYVRGVHQLTNFVSDFLYIFIEKFAPHCIHILPISRDNLKVGQEKIDYIINYKIQKVS